MKSKAVVLASMIALSVSNAYAGKFISLTQGVGGIVSADQYNGSVLVQAGNGGLLTGANNPNRDMFYIENQDSTSYLAGYGYNSDAGVIATTLNYRTFTPGSNANATISTGTLTLLDYRITENVPLLPGVAQGTVFDFVYRDSSDNKLVFGTRYMNLVDNDQEINYLYRQNAGDNPSVAWTFLSDFDLRMYQSGQTIDHSYNSAVSFTDGVVRQKADISVGEGNPWSGLYLVKTDALDYTVGANAIGYYQAGEEGQAVVGGFMTGFVQVQAVPEPESYALMLVGMGMIGAAARRRKTK